MNVDCLPLKSLSLSLMPVFLYLSFSTILPLWVSLKPICLSSVRSSMCLWSFSLSHSLLSLFREYQSLSESPLEASICLCISAHFLSHISSQSLSGIVLSLISKCHAIVFFKITIKFCPQNSIWYAFSIMPIYHISQNNLRLLYDEWVIYTIRMNVYVSLYASNLSISALSLYLSNAA